MRKTIKTAAVVAAMTAMTVAASTVAFADADERTNLSSTNSKVEAVDAAATGEWLGNDRDGWEFKVDGKKLDDTWAQIDGVWYYFDGTKMAQEELLYIDGESYFFNSDGSMMANGWVKLPSSSDAYNTVEINDELVSGNFISVSDAAYGYDDHIWLYFDENGVAKENEWFQADSGLWYFFDGNVMVMNTINYRINATKEDSLSAAKSDKIYGFDKNGAMLTGWNYKDGDTTWNNPTADAKGKTWYYYNSNGQMQTSGWKKIDGDWYLFAAAGDNVKGATDYADSDIYAAPYAAIINTYVQSDSAAGEPEYFYMDADGKMVTGIVQLPEKINVITFYDGDDSVSTGNTKYEVITDSKKPVINFASKGAATEDMVGNSFYYSGEADAVKVDVDFSKKIIDFSAGAAVTTVTGSAIVATLTDDDDVPVMAALLKDAFFVDSKKLYLADDEGDIVESKALYIGDDASGNEQYVILGSNGAALTGYTSGTKSVRINGVTYWSTENVWVLDDISVTPTVFTKNK